MQKIVDLSFEASDREKLIISLIFCLNVQAVGFFNFEKADEAYTAGEYETALSIYISALEMGYESADLYYNVANCHYRKGELAASILNYERALRLDPTNEDIKFNLEFVNKMKTDKIEPLERFFLSE